MSRHSRPDVNAVVRAAGVVWHTCAACGREWPFPLGVSPDVDPVTHENREWHCALCVNAMRARLERAKETVLAIINTIGDFSSKDEAVAAIEKEW